MTNKFIMLLIFLISITACKSMHVKKTPYNDPSDDATIKLAEAAHSVSASMLEMARAEKALTPLHRGNMLTIPNAEGLKGHVSVDWSGPIGEVTKRIAKASRYNFQVRGQEPAIPILVSVRSQGKTLSEILRNIDYQANNKASIHVYPKLKIIELSYANLYS